MVRQPKRKKVDTAVSGETRIVESLTKEMHALERRLKDHFEERLDKRLEEQTGSFKLYVGNVEGRLKKEISTVEDRLKEEISTAEDGLTKKIDRLDQKIDGIAKKLDTNTKGIVDLIERRVTDAVKIEQRVDDHELGITALEAARRN